MNCDAGPRILVREWWVTFWVSFLSVWAAIWAAKHWDSIVDEERGIIKSLSKREELPDGPPASHDCETSCFPLAD